MVAKSFLDVPDDHPFSLQNLPIGIFSTPSSPPRAGMALGEWIIDLSILADRGFFAMCPVSFDVSCLGEATLNKYMTCPRIVWQYVRATVMDLLNEEGGDDSLKNDPGRKWLVPMSSAMMHLPAKIGDYTDFYSSREHATNVGVMFRGVDNALQPNWLHLPVGYHGRASSVVVSGTEIVRPQGQLLKNPAPGHEKEGSIHGPCRLLDFELEMAIFVGGEPNVLGRPLTMAEADEHIFGLCLMNDWSARDIQKWEYVPLGPFTAKNFATTISPWIVSMDALQPFICPTSAGVQNDPEPLDYLKDPNYSSYDIHLEVAVKAEGMDNGHVITRSNFSHLYWNVRQQLVHHSVTGCNMQPGDLLGSGTISGAYGGDGAPPPKENELAYGSMLELNWKGTKSVALPDGTTRKFIQDGDTIEMRGICKGDGYAVGFGPCDGKILPVGSKSNIDPPPHISAAYSNFKLYGYWRSSCSWRVRLALELKGIPYEKSFIHLANGDQLKDEWANVNPQKQVPMLEFEEIATGKIHRLTQSVAIIEFLDEIGIGGKKLIPSHYSPTEKASVRRVAEIMNSNIQPLQNLATITKITKDSGTHYDGKAFGKDMIHKGLMELESVLTSTSGEYCVGDEVTMADCLLVPQLYNARRFAIDVNEFPKISAIEMKLSELPAFKSAHADVQPDANP